MLPGRPVTWRAISGGAQALALARRNRALHLCNASRVGELHHDFPRGANDLFLEIVGQENRRLSQAKFKLAIQPLRQIALVRLVHLGAELLVKKFAKVRIHWVSLVWWRALSPQAG